jgi:chitinase
MGLIFSVKEVVLANIKVVQEREAGGRVKEIYEDIKATMGWSLNWSRTWQSSGPHQSVMK